MEIEATSAIYNDEDALVLEETNEESSEFSGLVADINAKYNNASLERRAHEHRWLDAKRNYRGEYSEASLSNLSEDACKVFVKITKTKVLAAYGRITEVLFSTGKFPIVIDPANSPEGVAQTLVDVPEGAESIYGYPDDGSELLPGASSTSLASMLDKKYSKGNFVEGNSNIPEIPEIYPAEEAAKLLDKEIKDQLNSTNATRALRAMIFEMVLLGHGVLKGPFNRNKEIPFWERDEVSKTSKYVPIQELSPGVSAVSVWNFYPDPTSTSVEEAEWVIERHILNRSQFRKLGDQPYFRKNNIRRCLERGPNHQFQWYETFLDDSNTETDNKCWEVLEYWGSMDYELAKEAGLDLDLDWDSLDHVQVNAWICGDQILRLVINPFEPERKPYLACPYEEQPYQFWGIGVAENMNDSQEMMNGSARMAVDNLKLAGNLVFEIDESALVNGESMEIYPGKIFRRDMGGPNQAIYAHKFPNTTQENMYIFDRFRQFADEETGIPSYSHGSQGAQAMTRTASGMSMLMGAASSNIKAVIENIDDYVLAPLGRAMYTWNMQFNYREEFNVGLEVKAKGTASLMQKEVRSQRLTAFVQMAASNPATAPLIKWHEIISQYAETMDIDPSKILNNPEKAAIEQKAYQNLQQNKPQQTSSEGSTGNGDGTIGTGAPVQPMEPGFSGN